VSWFTEAVDSLRLHLVGFNETSAMEIFLKWGQLHGQSRYALHFVEDESLYHVHKSPY
jgi:hypothetical protein